MKNLSNYVLLLFIIACILSCKKGDGPINNGNTISVKDQLKSPEIVQASNKFGFNLFKAIEKNAPDKNIFISPFSALEALSMTYNGANGLTKTEMAGVLGFTGYSDDEVNKYNQSLTNALLKADNKVKFEVANSIWYDKYFHVLKSFLDVNRIYYNAEVSSLDFQSSDALITINNWVNSKTNGKIPTILDQLPANAVMYLINAIYFYGTWKYQFDKSKTIEADFIKEDGTTVQQQQMNIEEDINYFGNDDFQMAGLPYGNGTFNFIMILPGEGKNIEDILTGLNSSKWDSLIYSMQKQKVNVKMPKFKFEFRDSMNTPLKSIGMTSAFNPGSADFSRIDSLKDFFISRVLQKTYINLNEEGTEAAAVTVVEISKTTAFVPLVFNANRPFIYAITEQSTGAVLFIGKMMDPTEVKVEL